MIHDTVGDWDIVSFVESMPVLNRRITYPAFPSSIPAQAVHYLVTWIWPPPFSDIVLPVNFG
jgi:hypothetical protein